MKIIQKSKKKKVNQDYLLIKKAACYTQGVKGSEREHDGWPKRHIE